MKDKLPSDQRAFCHIAYIFEELTERFVDDHRAHNTKRFDIFAAHRAFTVIDDHKIIRAYHCPTARDFNGLLRKEWLAARYYSWVMRAAIFGRAALQHAVLLLVSFVHHYSR